MESISTHPWTQIRKANREASARVMIGRLVKTFVTFGDAAECVNPLVLREALPAGAKFSHEIDNNKYGKHFRETIEHILMNRWRVIHKRCVIVTGIEMAADNIAANLGISQREAMSMIRFEILDRSNVLEY